MIVVLATRGKQLRFLWEKMEEGRCRGRRTPSRVERMVFAEGSRGRSMGLSGGGRGLAAGTSPSIDLLSPYLRWNVRHSCLGPGLSVRGS